MENLLIDFNKEGYDSQINSLHNTVEDINEVIQAYNAMGLGEFDNNDFEALLFKTESYIFEKVMKDKPAEAFGMKVNKKKFWDDYLEKPIGYFNLIEAVELFKKKASIKIKYFDGIDSIPNFLKFFVLNSKGEFAVDENKIASLKSKFETYVYTEKGKLAYELATIIEKFLNKNSNLTKLGFINRNALEYFVGEAITINGESVSVRKQFITSAKVDQH